MQFLTIPTINSSNQVKCLISPRVHQAETLIKHSESQQIGGKLEGRFDTQQKLAKSFNGKDDEYLHEDNHFQFLKRWRLASSRSSSQEPSATVQNRKNGFYCFKKIREDKIKHNRAEGRIIKTIRLEAAPEAVPNNQQAVAFEDKNLSSGINRKPNYKKILDHLDEVRTIISKPSPRESFNEESQNNPTIQESQIIMRGRDLYNDIISAYENNPQENAYTSIEDIDCMKMTNSVDLAQTPPTVYRKQLKESSFIKNRGNQMLIATEPRICHKLQFETPQGKREANRKDQNCSAHENSANRFSFLKAQVRAKRNNCPKITDENVYLCH